jgi:hypothetical protein
MKVTVYLSVFLLSLLLGCTEDSLQGSLNDPLKLTGNAPSKVVVEGNSVELKVKSIVDQRCPPDVQCVWEGYVDVAFEISSQEEKSNFTICKGRCTTLNKETFAVINIGDKSYKFTLLEVSQSKTPDEVKTVTVKIEKA